MEGVAAQLEAFRDLRRELESMVLPLAGSLDGTDVTLQASLQDLAFEVGGYIVLGEGEQQRLAQMLALAAVREEADTPTGRIVVRAAQGRAVVLDGPRKPFHDLLARPAMLMRFGRRVTPEGGADVPATWARQIADTV